MSSPPLWQQFAVFCGIIFAALAAPFLFALSARVALWFKCHCGNRVVIWYLKSVTRALEWARKEGEDE